MASDAIRNRPRPGTGEPTGQESIVERLMLRQRARRGSPKPERTALPSSPAAPAPPTPPPGATSEETRRRKNPFAIALEQRRNQSVNQDVDPDVLRQRARSIRERRPRQ